MEKIRDGAELEMPLFVEVKEEPNSGSDEDSEEDNFQSNVNIEGAQSSLNKKEDESKSQTTSKEQKPVNDESVLQGETSSREVDEFKFNANINEDVSLTQMNMQIKEEDIDIHETCLEGIGNKYVTSSLSDNPRIQTLKQATPNISKKGHIEEPTGFNKDRVDEILTATNVVPSFNFREQSITESTKKYSLEKALKKEHIRTSSRCESSSTASLETSEKPFRCVQCGKAFSRKSFLRKHMLTHSGEKPYKCSQCGKAFADSFHLTTHMRVHSGEKPYKCCNCGKAFTQSCHLTAHMRIHSGKKPYKCSQCGKAFTMNSNLTTHMRIHSGEKPHKCSQCGKAFSESSHLKRHMQTHSGEKTHKCCLCGMAFTTNSHLTRHMRIHSGEKPYKCCQCGKAFTLNSHLTRHMRIHSGEKPYKCCQCGKAFSDISILRKHMLIHSG